MTSCSGIRQHLNNFTEYHRQLQAQCYSKLEIKLTRNRRTSDEWISSIGRFAAAYGAMINDVAFGIQPTCALARIFALLVHASFAVRAFWADGTFWTATWWRANEFGQARADSLTTDFTTLTVRSTRWGITWVDRLIFWKEEGKWGFSQINSVERED